MTMGVAPFTGARIETTLQPRVALSLESPPSRGRGLKPLGPLHPLALHRRPLHGGAD